MSYDEPDWMSGVEPGTIQLNVLDRDRWWVDSERALHLTGRWQVAVVITATETGLFPVDSWRAELDRLTQLATVVMNEHANDSGLCAICAGVAFPCASVALAKLNVAVGGDPQPAEPEMVSGREREATRLPCYARLRFCLPAPRR